MPQKLKQTNAKAKRRGNNEGSIYQRGDGFWCGAVTVGYKSDGKPIRKTVYGKTRQDVAKKVAGLSADVFKNGYSNKSARKDLAFETLMREWYDLYEAPNVEDVTVEKCRSMLRVHIFPSFGSLDVKDVDAERLQRFFNEKKCAKVKGRVGYSSDFIGKMKNLLNNFFRYAVKQQYVASNPMAEIDVRKSGAGNSEEGGAIALKPETRKAMLEWVEENPLLKPILITCTLTGMRPQEMIVMKWDAVNFQSRTINVRTALKRVVEFDEDWNVVSRGVKIGKTKTPSSVRAIMMPGAVQDVLQEWRQYCDTKGIQSEFVFPTKNGDMRTYSGLRSLFRRFAEKHGLDEEGATLYTLRHTFATILLEQRENPKIVMRLMGHAKVKTTLDHYSHVVDETVYEETAIMLDSVYSSLTKNQNP